MAILAKTRKLISLVLSVLVPVDSDYVSFDYRYSFNPVRLQTSGVLTNIQHTGQKSNVQSPFELKNDPKP